jgi:CBS domain-containing protein
MFCVEPDHRGFVVIEEIIRAHRGVLTIQPYVSAELAAMMLARHHIGCLVVVNTAGELVGIITERDLCWHVIARGLDPNRAPVGKFMVRQVVTCTPETSIADALDLMMKNKIRHLPVVRDQRPVAMVSIRDLLRSELIKAQKTIEQHHEVFSQLEQKHPGITHLEFADDGRVVMG